MEINISNYMFYYDPNTIKIYLDGEEQTQTVAFDIDEGWIDVYEAFVLGQTPSIIRKFGVVAAVGKWGCMDEQA